MRSLLALFLLQLPVAYAATPKCPAGMQQDDTFEDDKFSYQCDVNGYGFPQGCVTKKGEVLAFGESTVHETALNGEIIMHCKNNVTDNNNMAYSRKFEFRAKPADELRCADGRKHGEEFIPVNTSFFHRCVVNKESGQYYLEFVACAYKENKVKVGEAKEIDGVNIICTKTDKGYSVLVRPIGEGPSSSKGMGLCGNQTRPIGEEYTERKYFRKNCTQFGGKLVGCADSNGKMVELGGKSIEKENSNGVLEFRCLNKEGLIRIQQKFVLKPTDQLRCSNGKKIGEEYIGGDNNRFVYRCNVSEYNGEDASPLVGCLATDGRTTIYIGKNVTIGRFVEKCSEKDHRIFFIQERAPEVSCTSNGKEYKHNERFTVEGKFNFRCDTQDNGIGKVKFLNCKLPNGLALGLGKTQRSQDKEYTCKSETELIVQ